MADVYGIDESTLAALPEAARQRIYNALRVSDAVAKLEAKPEAKDQMQRLVAEHLPDLAGPEARARVLLHERDSRIESKLDEFLAGQAKEKEERQADDAKRRLEQDWLRGRSKLRERGYLDDGVAGIEKLMEERGIADHEAAAALFDKLHPPPEPAMTGGSRWNFFDRQESEADQAAFDALMKGDEDSWLAHSIPKALKEARGG